MMNDGKEWQLALSAFLLEAEKLLNRSEECLSHLHLIRNDSDAIDCMTLSLAKLAEQADTLALQAISEFSGHIHGLIANAENPLQLHDQALDALHDCLTLLAWQLELIDTKTGQLALDETEQTSLIATVTVQIPQKGFTCKPQQRLHHAS
ncbi:hypothetical protein [Pseudomonas rhodesiae]|uniref:hypothetical protein n=1 Tax=Pseudomonas rhodesiae TaxID=76760 RepID=UPI00241F2B2A|nr:hypothetical protein [Pseudomonas rhodesiae]